MARREILRLGHPVLRERARELSAAEIRSPEIQVLIEPFNPTTWNVFGIGAVSCSSKFVLS